MEGGTAIIIDLCGATESECFVVDGSGLCGAIREGEGGVWAEWGIWVIDGSFPSSEQRHNYVIDFVILYHIIMYFLFL